MGLFSNLFGFFGKTTSSRVSEIIAEGFIKLFYKDICPAARELGVKTSETEIFMCTSSIYIMAFARAAQSNEHIVSPTLLKRLAFLIPFDLAMGYSSYFPNIQKNIDALALKDEIDATTVFLMQTWNDSKKLEKDGLRKPDGVYWDFGKAASGILTDGPDPALAVVLAKELQRHTLFFVDYIQKQIAKYQHSIVIDSLLI